MSESLIEYWKRFKPKSGTFNIHPDDLDWFKSQPLIKLPSKLDSFTSFIQGERFGLETDRQFHPSLLPSPFHGNLANAEVLILLMNPGFIPSDYYAEEDLAFKAACLSNLRQTNGNAKFPFFGLNPRFAWSGAYRWAESKLRPIVLGVQTRKKCLYYEALLFVSQRIAILELIPYHSSSGLAISNNMWTDLPSAEKARSYVKERCVDKNPPLIVVARSHTKWDISGKTSKALIHTPRTRSITFSLKTDVGKEMLKRILGN